MSQHWLRGWRHTASLAFWLAVPVAGFPAEAFAQIPDEFTNLEVLPDDIEQRQLVNTMRGFAFGLGLTRLAMMKYGISDIRTLTSPDLRGLNRPELLYGPTIIERS